VEAMKPYRRMEIQLYTFLISTLDKANGHLHHPGKNTWCALNRRLYGLTTANKCPFSDIYLFIY
jgi:hypothetical protein